MRIDYHMHFEYGSYDFEWVKGFFEHAAKSGIDEIGISEHSHTFVEFQPLYEQDLILDDSEIGRFQKEWLKKGKFRYRLEEYLTFMDKLKALGYPVKTGIEVCNFNDQAQVAKVLGSYQFDYVIGSVHFLEGWGYDFSALLKVWDTKNLEDLYRQYVEAIKNLAASGLYDVLGHPFNIRLFKHLPTFDALPYVKQAVAALKAADMAADINTGTLYRYPIEEISPYPDFLKEARTQGLPVILSSDAHQPEDCGRYIAEAAAYAQSVGYDQIAVFAKRQRTLQPLS